MFLLTPHKTLGNVVTVIIAQGQPSQLHVIEKVQEVIPMVIITKQLEQQTYQFLWPMLDNLLKELNSGITQSTCAHCLSVGGDEVTIPKTNCHVKVLAFRYSIKSNAALIIREVMHTTARITSIVSIRQTMIYNIWT